MSFSGHKIGSPKGIGALFVDNTVSLTPIIFGGKAGGWDSWWNRKCSWDSVFRG